MKKNYLIEIAIWIFSIILLWGAIFVFQQHFIIDKKTYTLTFDDIDGIIKGSPVRFAGVVVGHVRDIDIHQDKVLVQIIITKPRVKIPGGSGATVESSGIAGSKSIEIRPPQENGQKGILVQSPIRLKDFVDSLEIYSNVLVGLENGLVKLSSDTTQDIFEKLKEPYDFAPINKVLDSAVELEKETNTILEKINQCERGISNILDSISKFRR